MDKKFKVRWSFMAASLMLVLFGLGVGGNVHADSADVTTPASSGVTAVSNTATDSNDQSSLHTGDSQWALQSSSQSTENAEEATPSGGNLQSSSSSLAGWNAVDSSSGSSDVNDSVSSSNSSQNGDTTTTYGNANDNNVGTTSSSAAASSSSSANSSSEPMLGLGDKGAAGAGTGADKAVKKIIDKVVPGGGLDNTKPNVPTSGASSTSSDQETNNQADTVDTSAAGSSAVSQSVNGSQGVSNSNVAAGAVAGVKRQTAIEKPNDTMTHNSFANRVSKSDTASTAKNNTKLVSFNTFSKIFYKQALSKKQNPGKFTTSKGKKVTITTPVSSVKYTNHDVNGVVETLPVIITLSIIGFVAISFIVFDPLRFIFR